MSGNNPMVFTTEDYDDSDDDIEDFNDVEEYDDDMETFTEPEPPPPPVVTVPPPVEEQPQTTSGIISQAFQHISNVVQQGAQIFQQQPNTVVQPQNTEVQPENTETQPQNTVAQPQTTVVQPPSPVPAAPQPAAPVQSVPEFVPLHRPPAVLEVTPFLPDTHLKLWHDFFNVGPINSEDVYSEYTAYRYARRFLWNRGWVTLVGFPGDGKRSTAEHIMIKFAMKPEQRKPRMELGDRNYWAMKGIDEEGREMYKSVFVNSYEEWKRKVDTSTKQCILIDKIFGEATFTPSKIEPWINHLDEILETAERNKPNTLVIITVQKHQLEKIPQRVTNCPLFQEKLMIDFSTEKFRLGSFERMKVLENNCGGKSHGLSFREQEEVETSSKNSFAFHARLYAGVKSFHMEGQVFFKNPEKSIESVLQKVFSFDKIIYYTLACVVLFDGKIELDFERFEDYDEHHQNIFRQLKVALEIKEDVDLGKIRYACTLLNGVFLIPLQLHHWKICHERMFYFISDSIFRKIPQKILEICSLDFLNERVRTSSYFTMTMESNLSVWNKDYNSLAQRLVFEILKGNVRLIASHPSLSDVRFGEAFVKFMAEMGSLQPVMHQRGDYNRSFFFWMAYYGHENGIKNLLKHEDMKDFKEEAWFKEELNLSLFAACVGNGMHYGRLVGILLENGASQLEAKENLPDEDFIELYGKEVFEVARNLNAPLIHVAAVHGSHDTLFNLVGHGADIMQTTKDGFTVLHRAARNPDDGALRALLKPKPNVKVKSLSGSLPIHEALRCGGESATRQLNWSGSDIKDNYKMEDRRSMLVVATGHGIDGMVRTVTNAMTNPIPSGCRDNWPALHTACAFGYTDIVKTLLERDGVNVNEKGEGGWTALHFAVLFNQEDIVKTLIQKKANTNIIAQNKKTPLHIAAENGYWNMVDILLSNKAKPENTTTEGDFALTSAALKGHAEVVKFLVEEGIELEFPKEREEPDPMDRERMYRMMMMMGRDRDRRMRDMKK